MGPTTRSATRSGSAMPRRLGTRSANTTNTEVTAATESTKDSVSAAAADTQRSSQRWNTGPSTPSPTMPATMAITFSPICTAVK